ncbi:TFIIB zinc-binding, partial [Halogranum amylolyticum]
MGANQNTAERGTVRETEAEPSEKNQCPECQSTALVRSPDRGELVCDDCGLVVDDNVVDHGPEWRAFDHSERQSKSRVGAPVTRTMHDKGLTTTIDWKNQDSSGHVLSS